MKPGLLETANVLMADAAAALQRHPKRAVSAMAALLMCATGLSYAVANLDQDSPPIAQRQITQSVAYNPRDTSDSVGNDTQALAMRLYRSDQTRTNDTADSLLKRLGIFDASAAAFLRSDATVNQNLMGRAGRNVTAEAGENNALLKLTARWSPEDDGMFKRLVVEKTSSGFASHLETLPMHASSHLASATINSSLFAATDEARIPDSVAIQLAEIFSGDIDFRHALRKGDRFSVSYETLEGDGEPLRAGRVLSAEFVNAGKSHEAMWFQEPVTAGAAAASTASQTLTKGGYYTPAGNSLHRAYLKSPLEFSRITSGFELRFHPILKLWKAHLGIDYGAATGTPVRTVADGVVEFAGVQNGFGNVIIIRHSTANETVYAHLSKINVQVGQHVTQGQNIGLVGATGWATGPHLHFEFRINGVHHDPLTVANLNESTPIAPAYRAAFDAAAAQVRAQFAAGAQMQLGSIE